MLPLNVRTQRGRTSALPPDFLLKAAIVMSAVLSGASVAIALSRTAGL